jgi:N-acetylmuramoyl-L-alanine amidase
VLALGVRRIVIDAGHGGTSPGTSTGNGVYEKEFTLDIATRLRDLLEKQNFEVVMTRTGDQTLTLENRANLANRSRGDVFVSIHLNWLKNPNNRGIETYYLGPTNDPHLNALAAAENRESGYSLSDMRNLLDGIYADVRQDESKRLAEAVQQQLYTGLKQVNPQLRDRGVKTAPFVVLVTTGMPAILAEVSCLSNQAEAELLKKPEYRQKIAEALSSGIRSYATPRDLKGI